MPYIINRMSLDQCEHCGHYLRKGKCPICILKCPFCIKNIGEYGPDGFFPGMCPHMICFSSFKYDVILWRSSKYKRKYNSFLKKMSAGISITINKRDYVIPFDSQYFIFTYFVQVVGLQMVEHKDPFDESPNSSIYLFILKNP